MKKHHAMLALVMALLFVFTYAGCSATSGAMTADKSYPSATTMAYATTTAPSSYNYTKAESAGAGSYDTGTEADSSLYTPADGRYVIKNANVTLQTEQYTESVAAFQTLVTQYGGYISNSTTGGNAEYYSRYMEATVRIPADKLESFLDAQNQIGTVTHTNIWVNDVTDQYVDNEARIASLETKKDRLMAILEKATKLSDIIELENALSETIYELEQVTGSHNKLKDRIDYSTVNLSLYEEVTVDPIRSTPVSLGERIAYEFEDSIASVTEFFEDLVVTVAGNSPVIILVLIFGGIIVLIAIRSSKKAQKKRMERLETYNRIKAQTTPSAPPAAPAAPKAEEKKDE